MRLKNEKGITLISLVITVIILTIIGAFSLNIVDNSTKTSEDLNDQTQLRMVQQAVLERYTKYTLTKDATMLVGEPFRDDSNLPTQLSIIGQVDYKNDILTNENYYRLLGTEADFNNLDIEDTTNKYIINYYTGEVMQLEVDENGELVNYQLVDENGELIEENEKYVIKQTSGGKLLYTYAKYKS